MRGISSKEIRILMKNILISEISKYYYYFNISMSYREDADIQILHGKFHDKNISISWQNDDMEALIRKYNYGIENVHLAEKSKAKITYF